MSIISSIKKFLMISNVPASDISESPLYVQLQANREIALRQVIPTEMMNEFLTFIYPNQRLKSIVKDMYHTYHDYLISPEARNAYLPYVLRLALSIRRFGHRLILHSNIDPEDIVRIMLENTGIEPTTEE
jgi:hypothetical protein